MNPRLLALTCCVLATAAGAADSKKDKPKGQKLEKIDLGLGNFKDLPKGGEMQKAEEKKVQDTPTIMPSSAQYSVVRVVHGKSFTRTAAGVQAAGAFEGVQLSNTNPPMTDKFSSVVRVKCPQKLDSGIEVAILDPRGDTVMSASGNITFRGTKSDEVEWTVDWDPSPVRSGGEFKLLVRVANEVMGTYPVKMIEAPPPAPKK